MNKEKINLLKAQLFLNCYKNDITDRYIICIDNPVINNDILNTSNELLYITTLDKHIKLQQRIDKAIEYINEQQSFVYGIRENEEFVWKDTETKKDLLEILKGEDK